jgi:hypothetical protein
MKLTFKEYRTLAERTMNTIGPKIDLLHMVVGMTSELSEVSDAFKAKDTINVGEECADICWYVANLANLVGIDGLDDPLLDLKDTDYYKNGAMRYFNFLADVVSHINDIVKKSVIYNRELKVKDLEQYMALTLYSCRVLCSIADQDLNEHLYRNIEKLKIRYPQEFSNKNAVHRNLRAERSVLQGHDVVD